MRNLEKVQNQMSHIPESWAMSWHEGNLIYPQSFAGYNAKLGPIIVKELIERRLSLNLLSKVTLDKSVLQILTDHSNAVHEKIGIPVKIAPSNIEILWSSSLMDIKRCLMIQVGQCVQDTSKLGKILSNREKLDEGIDTFFQSKRHKKHFDWIMEMWDIASETILSGPLKEKGKVLFQTIIDIRKNSGTIPDGRGYSVLKPIWYEIRDVTRKRISENVKLPFTPRRNRRIVDDFVYDFASGNVIQSGQIGEYARL